MSDEFNALHGYWVMRIHSIGFYRSPDASVVENFPFM